VENAEWDVLKEIMAINNGFLFCKYVKQFAIETHPHVLENQSHGYSQEIGNMFSSI
jgi:hypothetical protein